MVIYLSAPYDMQNELRGYLKLLEEKGHTTNSRWLLEEHEMSYQNTDGIDNEDPRVIQRRQILAKDDYDDASNADMIITFSAKPGFGPRRGGRHTEVGIGLAKGVPIIAVGERENLFYYLNEVTLVNNFEQALTVIENWNNKAITL